MSEIVLIGRRSNEGPFGLLMEDAPFQETVIFTILFYSAEITYKHVQRKRETTQEVSVPRAAPSMFRSPIEIS